MTNANLTGQSNDAAVAAVKGECTGSGGFNAESVLGAEGHGGRTKLDTRRSKHMRVRLAGSLYLFFAALAGSAIAKDRTIDDFTTGPFMSQSYRTGRAPVSSQNGVMLGGNRSTSMFVCTPGSCGFGQPASYEFQPLTGTTGVFLFNAGFGAQPRIDMQYGSGAPMSVNFTSYDRIRMNFRGLSQPLNFNIQVFTSTTWAQNGCNLNELNRPFSIELPFSGFIISGSKFSWSTITFMNNIFQSDSAIGSVDLAINSIVLSNTPMPGAQVCQLTH